MNQNILKRKELIDKLMNTSVHDEIKLLKGIRYSGKTTLMKSVIDELKHSGVAEENILYISFRSHEFFYTHTSYELIQIISEKIKDLKDKVYLFFDDVEEVENWQQVVNAFKTQSNTEIYASVNFSEFYNHGKAYLAGRFVSFEVFPFSFKEFLQYHRKFEIEEKSVKELFNKYLTYGGMPEFLNSDYNILHRDLNEILDVIKYCDIESNLEKKSYLTDYFLEFMIVFSTLTFRIKDFNRYYNDFIERDVIGNYIYFLINSMFVHESKSSNYHKLNYNSRYYLTDHAFFNIFSFGNNTYIVEKLETIIYVELLRRGYKVFFHEHKENFVDFICSDGNKRIYIQFDYIFLNENIAKKEIEYLNNVGGDNDKYIITLGDYDFSEYDVKHLNIIDFLTGDEI